MPKTIAQYTYKELTVGQTASFETIVTEEMIAQFTALSGDASPLHTDPVYASTTEFGRPVAHGMIAGMLFSRFVGMELPGKYCVYLSQQLRFHHPMFSDDSLLIKGEITQKSDAFKTITLMMTMVHTVSGKLLVDGEALVRVLT
ncbi:MAG: MaoC family dehydratase [bacterium]|nr:MaoC family dehydratase [bacterium]